MLVVSAGCGKIYALWDNGILFPGLAGMYYFYQEERAMKKAWFVLVAVGLVVGFGVSSASAKTYVSGNLGAVIVNDADFNEGFDTGEFTFDTGFGLTGALGGSLGNNCRGEVEFGYKANDIDKIAIDGLGSVNVSGDVTTISLMGNAYYDFPVTGSFSPFILGGIGFANVEADIDIAGSEDDSVFAYQLGLGGSLALSPELNLDLQYRFFGTSDPEFDGVEVEYNTQNLMVGLRYSF